MTPSFENPKAVADALGGVGYVADERTATSVFLAERMGRPLLIEGPAGVGKTELAKALAQSLGTELLRLQCYEGLDEAKALYEWEYPKQLLYAQMLRDKMNEALAGTDTLQAAIERIAETGGAFFSERFLVARPLLRAIRAPERVVLLIDEVDRSEAEFEAFLLEVLSEYQVSVPEIGTLKAAHVPFVLLTSNNAREMTDALRRRCLHLAMSYPDATRELGIIRVRIPGIDDRFARAVVTFVQRVRNLDVRKRPSVSETLDWARALLLLNATALEPTIVQQSLSVLLKYEGDLQLASERIERLLAPPSEADG
jgi:MoxR-like ATPase